jgi:hypothetical protein
VIGGERWDGAERRRDEQRARLRAAETEAFAHYGVDATSEPLVLADPPTTTRVVRVGRDRRPCCSTARR